MNTKLSQDAHDTLTAYEARQRRHSQGYGPKPPDPLLRTWAPTFTDQQKQKHDRDVIEQNLPF